MKTKSDIEDELFRAEDKAIEGCPFPGMTFSEGVIAALRWVLGEDDDRPMDD